MLRARDRHRRTGSFIRMGASVTAPPVVIAPTPPLLVPARSDAAPFPALARQQLVRRLRSPRPGFVVRKVRRVVLHPLLDDRGHPRPRALDLVGPGEQR